MSINVIKPDPPSREKAWSETIWDWAVKGLKAGFPPLVLSTLLVCLFVGSIYYFDARPYFLAAAEESRESSRIVQEMLRLDLERKQQDASATPAPYPAVLWADWQPAWSWGDPEIARVSYPERTITNGGLVESVSVWMHNYETGSEVWLKGSALNTTLDGEMGEKWRVITFHRTAVPGGMTQGRRYSFRVRYILTNPDGTGRFEYLSPGRAVDVPP